MIIYILYKKPAFFNQLIPVYNCPSVKAGIMMTKNLLMGNIRGQLVQLAFPLLLGNVLQQLYNAVDSIIIGRFVGSTAFAAVGVAGTVRNLFVFMISGVCVGVSILFAQLYGAQDLDGYRREVFLALSLGSGFTLVLTILSLMGLPWILRLIQTPAEVAGEAAAYLRIIFCGFLATYWYNLCAAILRSVGNTRIPLLFLAVAAAINTGLDLLFVAAFSMGVTGAAAATVIAQLISAACCSAYIWKRIPFAVFRRQDMIVDGGLLSRTVRFGLVSALQQSSLYIGKLLVQGAVNSLGTACISAFTAATRIEGFVNSFGDSGAEAIAIFVAQNTGAGQEKRAEKGFSAGIRMMAVLCLCVCTAMFYFAPSLISFFLGGGGQEEIPQGVTYLRIVSCFYLFCFLGASFVGYFRGTGRVNLPVLGTSLHIAIRVALSYLLITRLQLGAVAIATGAGWIVVVCLHSFFFYKIRKQ